VRSLESHNRTEETAYPGERVAVNLRGLDQHDINRGDTVTHPGDFRPSYVLDVKLKALERAPIALTNGKKVRLHHYTSEVEARVVLPNMESIEPGAESPAQLRATAPITAATGDRFVLRAMSPSVTLGGGVVVNPRAMKLKARTVKTFLEENREDETGIVASLIRSGGMGGVTRTELLGLSGLSSKRLDKALDELRNAGKAVRFDQAENRMVHGDFFEMIRGKVLERLKVFHKEHPLKEGMPKQELKAATPASDKLFKRLIEKLAQQGEIAEQGALARLAGHEVILKADEAGLKTALLETILKSGNAPPFMKDLLAELKADAKQVKSLIAILEREGSVVRVREDLYFSAAFIKEVKEKLTAFIKKAGGITPSQFNEITKSSRKYNIPLLEYLDRERFTMRVGDQRVIRGSAASGDGGKAE
jgi:selenocysteine-specific elongation factor